MTFIRQVNKTDGVHVPFLYLCYTNVCLIVLLTLETLVSLIYTFALLCRLDLDFSFSGKSCLL